MNKAVTQKTFFPLAIFLFYTNFLQADTLTLQNDTEMALWIQLETTGTCKNSHAFFSENGTAFANKQTETVSFEKECPIKTIKLYTQDPKTNPGTPITIPLYGQDSATTSSLSFSIEKSKNGKFNLKKLGTKKTAESKKTAQKKKGRKK